MRYPNYILFLMVLLGTSCRELTTLDLPAQEPNLVVEGYLSDGAGPQTVRLSLTQDYFDKAPAPGVEDVVVSISDDAGNREQLSHSGNGLYTTQALEGIIGRTYTLEINWAGQQYVASGTLMSKAAVDSLSVDYYEAIPPLLDAGYYITFYGRIPARASDYYRVKVYQNDSLYNDRTDLLIPDSRFVPDTIIQQLLYPFEIGDTVKVELYSLDADMYRYYQELVSLLFNDGGLFSPPPRNPTSNIRNVTNPERPPLGFFQVASFDGGTIIIEEEVD